MRIFKILLILSEVVLLWGCGDGCNNPLNRCYEDDASRDLIEINQFSMVALDSIIALNDSARDDYTVDIKSHYYVRYDHYTRTYHSEEFIPFTIETPYSPTLFMDIYGCDNPKCSNAKRIVFHDGDYNYVEALDKSSFSISKNTSNYYYEKFGEKCKLEVALFLRLRINTSRVKMDLNIQDATETCEVLDEDW